MVMILLVGWGVGLVEGVKRRRKNKTQQVAIFVGFCHFSGSNQWVMKVLAI
jgi:hypothetical protein